ncbi:MULTISPECIES: DeoR/GlpR family DNA-binding transcription regulator [Bacillus]|jgi:DeoR/GlpR family transcriptional regulator of sugar metabolism|uniref:DeoR family transcriptional regulator n=1 Tax=Bacillus toyonensis TaxID=155322 RepID=A0A2B6JMN8_9BACI|nr:MULTISPECIES: DeoR/GlpR family DNA-binding transcription regulator [Bacillus]EEL22567.1 Transcriptional regulator, DeoR [Bacillus cereus Rock1-3]EEL34066.1 Transcriptional regulator, DeoR [Bacillus cereus Rock3-28]EEL40013.1 Transcriptional regulator, DeoR [Bacillus cereus Rock3-29]KNH38521.1 cytochrome C [Bacillus thuringiensis]KXY15688.1 DeoR family transcriptional regulator [Bacillus cereus]MDH8705181.1 DeoR/GlpR family transcriptional regulator of sugar metabolism [Stenotrophomonas sp.
MFTEERREKILELLSTDGRVIVKDLAERFDMSIDSIRRDLSIMEKDGLLKRTHGGAIELTRVRNLAAEPAKRYSDSSIYEDTIARVAVSYIKEGDSIFIGGASVHNAMLKYLPEVSFTVITNSIEIAGYLREYKNIDTYLIGGKVKPSGNITDTLASELISRFSIDLYFSTGGGISLQGISTATPEVAYFSKRVSEIARRNICLVPHNKLGIDCFIRGESLKEIDIIITDEEASKETVQDFEKQGKQVVIAPLYSFERSLT